MEKMHRIYINSYLIQLVEKPLTGTVNVIGIDQIRSKSAMTFIKEVSAGLYGNEIILSGETPEVLFQYFSNNLRQLIAGGGLVENSKGEILFIHRTGRWDFPKGKPENGESIEETAIREVEEECGIGGLKILSPLPDTFHIYADDKGYILKRCIWFHMRSNRWENSVLQTEEGITDALWLSKPFKENILQQSFPSIKDLALWFQDHYLPPLRS